MAKRSKVEEKAYIYIREQITSSDWSEGRQLKELDIANELSVSRTPVRKALKTLEENGYVTIKPNRGVYVTQQKLDLKDTKERIYYLEVLLQHIFYTFQLNEIKIDVSVLRDDLNEMGKKVEETSLAFEEIEIKYWQTIFSYHSNNYMNQKVIQTLSSLYQTSSESSTIFRKSRPMKLKYYKNILQWIEKEDYTYARREVRILLNQLLVNLIQGVE